MKSLGAAAAFLLLPLAAGCVRSDRGGWRPAPVDSHGRVYALTVHYKWREDFNLVPSGDHAVLVVWTPQEQCFYLFDVRRKTMLATRDFEFFLRELEAIPSSSLISWVDTCSAPRSWAMPEPASDRLGEACQRLNRKGIAWAEPSIACYCESQGMWYPPLE